MLRRTNTATQKTFYTDVEEPPQQENVPKFRLRFLISLVVSMAALLALPVIVLVIASSLTSQLIANDLSNQITSQTYTRVSTYVQSILMSTTISVREAANVLSDRCMVQNPSGVLSRSDQKWALEYLYQVLINDRSRSTFGFGIEESGDYCGATLVPSDFTPLPGETEQVDSNIMFNILERYDQNDPEATADFYWYRTKSGQWRLFDQYTLIDYDPRGRPWYTEPKARREVTITPAYVSEPSLGVPTATVGISVGAPINNKVDGSLIGIVYADYDLSALTAFVSELNITTNGFAFVAEFLDNGDNTFTKNVFAYKDPSAVTTNNGEFIPVEQMNDTVLQQSLISIPNMVFDGQIHRTDYIVDGVPYIGVFGAASINVRDPLWVVGVVVPYHDIYGTQVTLTIVNIIIGAVCLIIGALFVGLFASKAYKQIDLERKVKERTAQLEVSLKRSAELLQRIAAEEEKTQAIINMSPDAIVGTTRDGIIKIFNSTSERMFKLTSSEVISSGLNIIRFVPTIFEIISSHEKAEAESLTTDDTSRDDTAATATLISTNTNQTAGPTSIALNDVNITTTETTDNEANVPQKNVFEVMALSKFGEKFTVQMSYSKSDLLGAEMYLFIIRDLSGERSRPIQRRTTALPTTLPLADISNPVLPVGTPRGARNASVHGDPDAEGKVNVLDAILMDPKKKEEFRKWCEQEFNLENLLFVDNVNTFRNTNDVQQRAELADSMIENYLTVDGKFQLNIPERYIREIISNKDMYRKNLFDNAEVHVRSMLVDTIKSWQRSQATAASSSTQE